jgi:hypothetical protein
MSFAERRTAASRDDWRTPAEEIELVKRIFGGPIDLDPCADYDRSNWFAITNFSHTTEGLFWEWWGNVFINPPYGRELVYWVRHGRANQQSVQIWLVPGRAFDTQWWKCLMNFCDIFAIKDSRIKFGGADHGAMFPSALCYCGTAEQRFVDEVRAAGWTVYRKV